MWPEWRKSHAMNDRLTHPDPKPDVRTISDLLSHAASARPDELAAADATGRWSYSGLQADVQRYAKALFFMGIRRGDRVAMLTPPGVDFWIALHATASLGAIWVGVNPRYQQRDFEHLISDSQPSLLIAVSPFDDRDYCAELAPLLPPGTWALPSGSSASSLIRAASSSPTPPPSA